MNSLFGKPESICLQGTTDAFGKYVFSKINNDFIKIDRLDEVCVTDLGLNNEQIHNVREKQIVLKQSVLDSRGQENVSEIYMPTCRIVTVRQLCEQLAAVTDNASSRAEWKVKFLDRATCVIKPSSQTSREMVIPANIGFCLGLCDLQGNPSAFSKLMISSYNTGDTITISRQVVSDQTRWLSLQVAPQIADNDFVRREGIPVCRPLDENIWRYVSENSFATLFVNGNFITESYVGRERVQVMDVFEYNTYKLGNWTTYAPPNVQWKRVNVSSPEDLVFEFTTERNQPLSNVDFILHLNFRKKNVY